MADLDVKNLVANYELGQAVTYEEMMRVRAADSASGGDAPDTSDLGEVNPYLFDDKQVDSHTVCIVSFISPSSNQKHRDGKMYIKLRAACESADRASKLCKRLDAEKCDLFVIGMYHFVAVPITKALCALGIEERDHVLNDALEKYKRFRLKAQVEFEQRKQTMMDDMQRQEDMKQKFRDGLVNADELDSGSVFPEEVGEPAKKELTVNESDTSVESQTLLSDSPVSEFKYSVMAIIDLRDVEDVSDTLAGGCILKVCAVFRTEGEANKHAELLRKKHKYKHIDLYVVCMYEWLELPPDQSKLESVQYKQPKLTEIVGQSSSSNVSPMELLNDMVDEGV